MTEYSEIVKATVQAGLVAALDKDSEKLIKSIVSEVLTKKDGYYSSTFIDGCIKNLIEDVVRDSIRSEIESRREAVLDAVKAKIDGVFFEKIIDVISTGIAQNLKVSFELKRSDYDD